MTESLPLNQSLASSPLHTKDVQRVLSQSLPWKKLEGQSFVVSGAAGMLAQPLIEVLLALPGTAVHGLVRNRRRALEQLGFIAEHPQFHCHEHDVCNPLQLDVPVDYVIHAASPASPKTYGSSPIDVVLPNTVGTHHLLKFAQAKQAKRFLFFSSAEVYGKLPAGNAPITEASFGPFDPLSPRACYGESKRLGETLCQAWQQQHDLPVTIIRPFHTYGPHLKLDDGRVFADFVANIVRGEDIVLKSSGSAQRSFAYVSDAMAGLFTAWLLGTPGEAYNIGNDEQVVSVRELAERLVSLYPEKQLKVITEHDGHQHQAGYVSGAVETSVPDCSKIRALGWTPQVSIDKGFRRTIDTIQQSHPDQIKPNNTKEQDCVRAN